MNLDSKEAKKKKIGFQYAIRGLKYAFKSEFNLRIHFLVCVIVFTLGLICEITRLEWAILFLTCGFVISMELVNSTIELIMDYLYPDEDTTVGTIKDIAAGAVLCAAITSILVGLVIFVPKLAIVLYKLPIFE